MVKRDSDDYIISETGNWNTAADYSKIKIMRPLDNADVYENMSIFGYDSVLDQLTMKDYPVDEIRLIGFKRLIRELLKVIQNAKFAMKKGQTKNKAEEYEKELKRIWKIIPYLSAKVISTVRGTSQIKLKQPQFDKVLECVIEIKCLINTPLNQNHLIFTDKEEPDINKLKEQIIRNATTRG